MNQYLIYLGSDGYVKSYELKQGETYETAKAKADAKGLQVLRDKTIVGTDNDDAVDRYARASQLRKEAADITSKGQQEQQNMIAQEKADAEAQGGVYGKEPTFGRYAMQLLKAPQTALVAGVEALPSLKNPTEFPSTLAKKFQGIYQDPNLAEEIATDPTLLVPGTAELKAIQNAPRVLKALRYAVKPLKDALVQTTATVAKNELEDGETGDVEGNIIAGTVGGVGAKGVGSLAKASGKKILQSVIKPKTGSDREGVMVENLMNAKTPEGKNVIGANESLESMYNNIEDNISAFGELQRESLTEGKGIYLLNEIKQSIDDLRMKLDDDLENRIINEKEYEKAKSVLDLEENRLMGITQNKIGTPSPVSEVDLHEAKMAYGKKSRYDVTNESTSDPTVRDVYRDLFGKTRGIITDSQADDVGGVVSDYDKYSKAMAPLMEARAPVGKALERTSRNQALTLPMMLAASAGGSAGGMKGALIGATVPMFANAPRIGTTLIRAEEPIKKTGRYAISTKEAMKDKK